MAGWNGLGDERSKPLGQRLMKGMLNFLVCLLAGIIVLFFIQMILISFGGN